jgi:hypothetical protein
MRSRHVRARCCAAWIVGSSRRSRPYVFTASVPPIGVGDITRGGGPLGGIQIADLQAGKWVFGADSALNAPDLRGGNTCFSGLGGLNGEHAIGAIGTATGRVGFAFGRSLIDAKARGAWPSREGTRPGLRRDRTGGKAAAVKRGRTLAVGWYGASGAARRDGLDAAFSPSEEHPRPPNGGLGPGRGRVRHPAIS